MENLSKMLDHNHHLLSEPTDLITDQTTGHHIITCYLRDTSTQYDVDEQEDLVQAIKDMMYRLLHDCKQINKITIEVMKGEHGGQVIMLDRRNLLD